MQKWNTKNKSVTSVFQKTSQCEDPYSAGTSEYVTGACVNPLRFMGHLGQIRNIISQKKEIKLISKTQLNFFVVQKQQRIEGVPKEAFLWNAIRGVTCMG